MKYFQIFSSVENENILERALRTYEESERSLKSICHSVEQENLQLESQFQNLQNHHKKLFQQFQFLQENLQQIREEYHMLTEKQFLFEQQTNRFDQQFDLLFYFNSFPIIVLLVHNKFNQQSNKFSIQLFQTMEIFLQQVILY